MMKFKPKLSPFLPLLALVCLLSFSIRGVEVWSGYKDISGSAFAEDVVENAVPPSFPDEQVEEDHSEGGDLQENSPADMTEDEISDELLAIEAEESGDPYAYSPLRAELAQDLAKRRKELDSRETTLMQREALLEAAEKELERKYNELTALRMDIEALLNKQSEEENARIQSLVKIYEGMKAKDAANIFNTLDLDVLVDVMSRMSERKASPILAAMTTERARTVTILLAEQKKLPELPIE